MLIFILPLLIALPTNFGTPLQGIYLAPSSSPGLSLVTTTLKSGSVTHFMTARRLHLKYPSSSQALSQESQGPVTGHPGGGLALSPSSAEDCSQTCAAPLTSTPFGSSCMCVLPMRVRLLLGVPLYAIFSVVSELEIEVAAGTYLKQSQVRITGANSDDQNPERAVVDLNLVPLGEKFDNTTAILTYQRIFEKKVALNRTLFGDYDVISMDYPGLPSSPSGGGSTGRAGNGQDPISVNPPNKIEKSNKRIIFVITFSIIAFLVSCLATSVVLLKCRKVQRPSKNVDLAFSSLKKSSVIESMLSSSPSGSTSASIASAMPPSILSVKTFSLAELRTATENFNPKKVLGEGGFGRVYLGTLQDGSGIAVKLLTRDDQNGEREFIAEIETLSRLHHRNLVKLIGICIEQHTRCLVYALVPNGSIESHLHGADRIKGNLNWDARLKVALGAARGLAYLHEDSNPRVIHRDFKASNILLEDDFTPKVSDFGLAREATEGSHHISTRVMGTFGYVAPEYAMTGHLLIKSDVYSYGVVLLELLSSRKPVDMSQPPGQENLVTWARPLLTNQEGLKQLVDPALAGTYSFGDLARVAAIASMCVHPEVAQRPFMGEVVQALKLIYNDTDEMGEDACSPKESASDDLHFKGNWWSADHTPPLTHREASTFITMEYCSDPHEEVQNRTLPSTRGTALPIRHNQSDPSSMIRCNPVFLCSTISMSEHGRPLNHAWYNGRYHGGSF